MKNFVISSVVIVVIGIFYGVSTINSAVSLDESVSADWAQVENLYQRRFDLIPNLVATVKGYAQHEQNTLNQVVAARSQAMQTKLDISDTKQMEQYMAAQDNLSGALSRLMAIAEAYPDLKANSNFLELQSQLEGTENRIAVARRDYIQTVKKFNIKLRTIPSSWIINHFTDLTPKAVFSVSNNVKENPKVQF